MNAKKFLSEHYFINLRIEAQLKQIDELKDLATSTGSFSYSADKVIVSLPLGAGFENKVIKIADLEKDIQEDIKRLRLMRKRIVKLLKELPERDRTIMTLRYLDHMKWQEVAEIMGYEEITVKKRNTDILKYLDSKYDFVNAK